MHLSEFAVLVVATLAAIAAGLAWVTPNHRVALVLSWIAALSFGTMGPVWSATAEGYSLATQLAASIIVAAIAALGLAWAQRELRRKEQTERFRTEAAFQTSPVAEARGGKGGSGQIFGNNGTIVGGKGGNVGPGGQGRGGDGGSGVIHGDGGLIISGEGGSVDGTNIWFPPAQSAFIQILESQGQTPDFGVQYPGAGGATGGWLQRQQIVAKLREEFFKKTGQQAKIESSKIGDVPLEYINEQLKKAGHPWRARIEKKYWYLYYVP